MKPGDTAHIMLRVTRLGPLVPARIWLCDHDPADESNKRDRGNLSIYPRAEIAGDEVDPDILQRDRLMSPTDWRPAYAVGHWKYPSPVSAAEYRYQIARRAWAERHQPADPTLRPRKKIDVAQLPLPSFERESA
jgi:hypothetical protein